MSYGNEVRLIISDQIPKGNLVKGGIRFEGSASSGTLLGDFAGKSQSDLMEIFPFSEMTVEDRPSYTQLGVLLNVNDSFMFMPNCWRYDKSGEDGSEEHWVANYKVNSDWKKSYPGDFTRLGLSKYLANEQNSYLHSIPGVIPTVNMNQVTAMSKMPYYKRGSEFRRAVYMDGRVWRQYQILCMIYLGTRNSQNVYIGMTYPYSKGTIEADVTDERSRYTGVTEESGSIGRLSHGVISGEITGTSTTASINTGKRPFQLLGIENPYAFLWTNIYGVFHNSGHLLISKGTDVLLPSELDPSSNAKYTDVGDVLATSDGWQKQTCEAEGYGYVRTVGGDSSIYNGDYYWCGSNYKLFLVGGAWGYGLRAGLSAFAGDDAFGAAWTSAGFRLSLEL